MNKKETTRTATDKPETAIAARTPSWALLCLLWLILQPSQAHASSYSVTPTSLDLSSSAKSGAFSVLNSGDGQLKCQIDVKEWSQDSEGKDVYTEAKDIVFFPKIMTVEVNEQRAIRIGVKGPPSQKERTYRIFVEEIPSQKKAPDLKAPGKIAAGLTIAFRYAVPIFVMPMKRQESSIIEKIELSKGMARTIIRNTGNVHIKLSTVAFRGKTVDGKELFVNEAGGWYVLNGMSRKYEATVPKEHCGDLAVIEVIARSESSTITGSLHVDAAMCAQ